MAETTKELRAVQLVEMGKLDHFDPVGSPTVFRLDSRQWFRPAGNSVRFWKKIEADDPFKPKRAKLSPHRPVYASGRFVRLEDVAPPKPKPPPKPTPQARRLAKFQPEEDTKGPSQVHTPDRKIAPSPLPRPEQPSAPEAPKAAQRPTPTEPIDRTPPKIIPNKPKRASGRIRASGQPQRRSRKLVQGGAPPTSRPPDEAGTASQANSEPVPDISPKRKLGKRDSAPPPAARNIDSVLGVLGALKAAQDQVEHDKDLIAQGLLPDPQSQQKFAPPPAESSPKQPTAPKDPKSVPPTARKRTFGTESAPAPEARNIDSVLGVLGALKAAQDQHHHEKEMKDQGLHSDKDIFGEDSWSPPPKPKRQAGSAPTEASPPKPKPVQAASPPKPKPEPTPPSKPKPPPKKASPNRAPPKPGGGSLDDLFGGGNEGRLRIGKRTKPKPTEED